MFFISVTSVLQALFIAMWVQYEPMKYGATYTYPPWAQAVGLMLAFSSMLCIPAYAVYAMLKAPGTLREVSQSLLVLS